MAFWLLDITGPLQQWLYRARLFVAAVRKSVPVATFSILVKSVVYKYIELPVQSSYVTLDDTVALVSYFVALFFCYARSACQVHRDRYWTSSLALEVRS